MIFSSRRPQDDANNSRTRPVWILISPAIELSSVKNVTPDWVYTILAMISKHFMAHGFFDQRRKNLDQSLFENWFILSGHLGTGELWHWRLVTSSGEQSISESISFELFWALLTLCKVLTMGHGSHPLHNRIKYPLPR